MLVTLTRSLKILAKIFSDKVSVTQPQSAHCAHIHTQVRHSRSLVLSRCLVLNTQRNATMKERSFSR